MRELVPPTHHHTASHTEQREKDICPLPELCAASIDRAARCGRHAFAFSFCLVCSCLAYVPRVEQVQRIEQARSCVCV